jgi:hypothetical protein
MRSTRTVAVAWLPVLASGVPFSIGLRLAIDRTIFERDVDPPPSRSTQGRRRHPMSINNDIVQLAIRGTLKTAVLEEARTIHNQTAGNPAG